MVNIPASIKSNNREDRMNTNTIANLRGLYLNMDNY